MIDRRAKFPMPEDTIGSSDVNSMMEMRASIDELHRQNEKGSSLPPWKSMMGVVILMSMSPP